MLPPSQLLSTAQIELQPTPVTDRSPGRSAKPSRTGSRREPIIRTGSLLEPIPHRVAPRAHPDAAIGRSQGAPVPLAHKRPQRFLVRGAPSRSCCLWRTDAVFVDDARIAERCVHYYPQACRPRSAVVELPPGAMRAFRLPKRRRKRIRQG